MIGVDLQTENVAHLIQLALGPVFLISGVGITLSMLTQRLARIVDRARTLEDQTRADHRRGQAQASSTKTCKSILRRSRYINSAIALCTTSALLTTLVVTLLFASEFSPSAWAPSSPSCSWASMACLSTAFLMFLIEVRIATNTLRIGVQKHDK